MSWELAPLDPDGAADLDGRIRRQITAARTSIEDLAALLTEAQARSLHLALGLRSWSEYLGAVFADNPLRIEADERRRVVAMLAAQGMATRAIAPVVGVNQATVVRDLSSGDAFASPAVAITGRDGKTYSRPPRPVTIVDSSPSSPERAAVDEAARAALDAELARARQHQQAHDAAQRWHRASSAIDTAARLVDSALVDDPGLHAFLAVAGHAHLDLLSARIDALLASLDRARPAGPTLRRIK